MSLLPQGGGCVLETALAEDLSPGSNLPNMGPDTLWVHLLPDLEPRHVGWFGPPQPTIAALLSHAGHTTIFDLSGGGVQPRRWRLPRLSPDAVASLAAIEPLDLAIVPCDLAAAMARRSGILESFVAALAPDAVVLIRHDRYVSRTRHRRAVSRFGAALGSATLAELSAKTATDASSAGGLAVPVQRPARLHRSRARAKRVAVRLVRRLTHLIARSPSGLRRAREQDITLQQPRRATARTLKSPNVVLLRRGDDDASRLPAYIAEVAARWGLDLTDASWSVAPPRGYRSQKVIFALTRRGSQAPDLIVKMTQEARFNGRLDNERRALELLADVGVADEQTVPQIVFAGTHGGLLIVGESALVGHPFRVCSTADARCPIAAGAIAWLTELAVETAGRAAGRGSLSGPLELLVERYLATFDTDPSAREVLLGQAKILASSQEAIPAVMSHGDPGTWNLLVGPGDRVGFLDWENFEAGGMPAWDLLLFLKTFASLVSEASGNRPTVGTVLDLLCRPGPFNTLAQRSFRTYAVQLGLDRALLPQLVLMCWIHQSLKEASRLAPSARDRSKSRQIVARCLAEPHLLTAMTGA